MRYELKTGKAYLQTCLCVVLGGTFCWHQVPKARRQQEVPDTTVRKNVNDTKKNIENGGVVLAGQEFAQVPNCMALKGRADTGKFHEDER